MGKFSSTDIIRICNKYLSDDTITFDDIALSYGVSRSTITKNIYRGIVMGDVSIPIAERLMQKADANVNRKMYEMNKRYGSSKVRKKYEDCIRKYYERRDMLIALEETENNIEMIEDKLDGFDQTYSSEDELFISKESLESQLNHHKRVKADYEKRIKEIEKSV